MMSLKMMGLTPGPLVHALFLLTLMNPWGVLESPLVVVEIPLVMFVSWGLVFWSQQELSQLLTFSIGCVFNLRSTKAFDS